LVFLSILLPLFSNLIYCQYFVKELSLHYFFVLSISFRHLKGPQVCYLYLQVLDKILFLLSFNLPPSDSCVLGLMFPIFSSFLCSLSIVRKKLPSSFFLSSAIDPFFTLFLSFSYKNIQLIPGDPLSEHLSLYET
jgi:hypothetical protein